LYAQEVSQPITSAKYIELDSTLVSSESLTQMCRAGLWYFEPNAIGNATGYAKFFSRSHDAVIRVYDDAGNVIETHEHTGEFKEL
jgi:hypothetical protein